MNIDHVWHVRTAIASAHGHVADFSRGAWRWAWPKASGHQFDTARRNVISILLACQLQFAINYCAAKYFSKRPKKCQGSGDFAGRRHGVRTFWSTASTAGRKSAGQPEWACGQAGGVGSQSGGIGAEVPAAIGSNRRWVEVQWQVTDAISLIRFTGALGNGFTPAMKGFEVLSQKQTGVSLDEWQTVAIPVTDGVPAHAAIDALHPFSR
ncbi:hypothetical protein [Breoghania corrubedonensis]|uniref:hypothetical protein n=1 Tax=Breoghania corrubedonensis TaxID=665038 RepID=UPI0011B1DE0E|nr:hypothetical protein [Breoghania corrubedonensis]